MPRYAVKIGEVHLVADVPITDEDRDRAMVELREDPGAFIAAGYAVVRTELTCDTK